MSLYATFIRRLEYQFIRQRLREGRWLTTVQLAARIGVSYRTVTRYVDRDGLPAVKYGRWRVVDAQVFENWWSVWRVHFMQAQKAFHVRRFRMARRACAA